MAGVIDIGFFENHISKAMGTWEAILKILSIRQPWAWLIIHGGKDIENRTWHTKYRGRFLVHASKGMTRAEYNIASWVAGPLGVQIPPFEQLLRGGIVGSVELVDSVDSSNSPWYMGSKGFVLRDPVPLPFTPLKGQLGFFEGAPGFTNDDVEDSQHPFQLK